MNHSVVTARHRVPAAVGLLIVWALLSLTVPARLIPSPWQTALARIHDFSSREGLYQVAITLFRVGVGFALSLLIGVVVGGLMSLIRGVERTLGIWIVAVLTISG